MTPMQRTLKWLRENEFVADVTERRIRPTVTKDLFGFIDILAVKDGETHGIQVTSGSNVAARVKKIEDSEHLSALREAEWRIWVMGWRKNAAGRWVHRIVDVS